MAFSNYFVQELKSRNNIVDVISSYVTLKKAGSNFTGLCPFHSEKTPSFTVFPKGENYFCFGCEAAGDVITFIMKMENLDYLQALEFLCNRAGMKMPDSDGSSESNSEKRQRFYSMNREAAIFFVEQLKNPANKEARDYVFNKRGLSNSTVTHFGIGYNPKGSALYEKLHGLGYTDKELKENYLCMQAESGRHYDYFGGRVIFPIVDNMGRVLGFGGRIIQDDVKPKYLNTSDTLVFKKGKNLYSLNYARSSCKEFLLLCEGYMDVIGMNLGGFPNSVATLGTALTEDQARLISKYTDTVIVCYDNDQAGQNATMRALEMFKNLSVNVKILRLDGDAKDPDEYVKKYGKAKFEECVKSSTGKLEFILNELQKKYNFNVEEEKIRAIGEACDFLSEIESEIEREVYIGKLAQRTGVNAESIKLDVEKRRRYNKRKKERKFEESVLSGTRKARDMVNREFESNPKVAGIEEEILSVLLNNTDLIKPVIDGTIDLKKEDFLTEFNRRIFVAMTESDGVFEEGALNGMLNEREFSYVMRIKMRRSELKDNGEEILSQLAANLKHEKALKQEEDPLKHLQMLMDLKKKNN